MKCRCGDEYCPSHLHNHNCSFDYHGEWLKTQYQKPIVAPKIQKI